MSLTIEDINTLSKPFPDNVIGVKVNNFSKDKSKAMLVLYLQHTDVYARIEEVDPAWSCEATNVFFNAQSLVSVQMKMTNKGVTRENLGEAEDYKSAYSDALKRVAMLFGVGRYLYDSEQVWVPYDDSMKYKTWTIQDFRKLVPRSGLPLEIPTYFDAPPPEESNEEMPDFDELPVNNPSPNIPPTIDDQTFTIGKMTGKKFSQLAKNTSFLTWVNKVLEKDYAKAHQELKNFHQFARQKGAYRK